MNFGRKWGFGRGDGANDRGANDPFDIDSLWRRASLPPLHGDAWRVIPIFAVAALILFWIWTPLGWIGVAATLWCATLFRLPERLAPLRTTLAISPIDGTVDEIGSAPPPGELALGAEDLPCICIALGPWDSHVVRAAAAGRLAKLVPGHDGRGGEFIAARIEGDRHGIGLRLVAEGLGRRVRIGPSAGAPLTPGDALGMILFAGRVEIFLPRGTIATVAVGQRMVAGETVLAEAAGVDDAVRSAIPPESE